jgi:hypothetical protein
LDEKMNLQQFRPAIRYAIALPIAIALFGGLLAGTGTSMLLPLGLILVLVLPYLAAGKVPSAPIRTALFTVSPTLLLQVVVLIVLAATGISRLLSSRGPEDGASAAGFILVGAELLLGNIFVISVVAVVAGWLAKMRAEKTRKMESSNQASDATSEPAPGAASSAHQG